jgi:hypothetical protein
VTIVTLVTSGCSERFVDTSKPLRTIKIDVKEILQSRMFGVVANKSTPQNSGTESHFQGRFESPKSYCVSAFIAKIRKHLS